jgi:gag-polypeptide of LTR copia-type
MTSSEFRIAKLTADNYFDWVVEAEAALCVKGLWPAVEEDTEFRSLDASERKRKQREARGFLILCISPEVRDGIVSAQTPKEIWEKLHDRFCQKTNEQKADLIERLTSAEQKSGESIATFVNRLETLKRFPTVY